MTFSIMMVLFRSLVFVTLLDAALSTSADNRQYKIEECNARFLTCTAVERQIRPVCGTDNQTYPSRCQLTRTQCQGAPVNVKHRGRCKELQPCWADLRYSQKMRRPPQVALFVPKCLEDGSYAPVQCHAQTGFCWCVSPAGKPVPNSSLRYSRPNCNRKAGKSSTRRRSSPRGRRQKKGCGRMDRIAFNNNLIKTFKTEYKRQIPPEPPGSPVGTTGTTGTPDRTVLDWKFSSMDNNNDDFLVKSEYRDLRRLVKKSVKPKRCAKTFTRLCDLDLDERISRDEWAACLGLDFNLSFRLFLSLNSDEGHEEDGVSSHEDEVLQGTVTTLSERLPEFSEELFDRKDEPEANDCLSDRKAVLDEQKTGTSELYVPECTSDGRYNKVQCYKSTGYCWCVQEDNGKPIPGTSVKDQDPKCDSVPVPPRPMNGCPEPRKQAFLKELMDFMLKKMMASTNKSSSMEIAGEDDWPSTQGEQVAKWNFFTLDKNKNKMLERKEWKNFRTLVATNQQLRRCGKRLPRYCDVNHDRKISITEWLNCLNTQASNTSTSIVPTTASRRRGLNPLQIYLNGDD